jgi:glycosyltransferase involved in cell wall biosynthesis
LVGIPVAFENPAVEAVNLCLSTAPLLRASAAHGKSSRNLEYRRNGEQHADMSTPTPAISVLMPVHNAGCFLAPAIESVLAQTFSDFELIVVVDGATDGSNTVLREIAARDARAIVVEGEHAGLVAALNRGLSMARAPLVARMDADDLSRPDRFAKQVAYLREHPEIAVLSGAIDLIDANGVYLRTDAFPTAPDAIKRELPRSCCICHPAVMARTGMLRSVGGYRIGAEYAEDYDLWLRVSEVGEIANLPDVLLSYRMHPVKASTRHLVAADLAVIAARGAALLRRSGKSDPLAADVRLTLDYRSTQLMLADAIPRPQFALSFFRSLLGREAELGSIGEWSKLYARHGLNDLDARGAALMVLLLGHNMARRRRAAAPLRALVPYPFWALVTLIRHPLAAWLIARNGRSWIAQARTERPTAP